MAHVIVLVGAPGSGKDTWALEEATNPKNSDYDIHSSDDIRLELFGELVQDKNEEVFNEMKERTKRSLKNGRNVIYNATNISRKKRAALYKELKMIKGTKVGICLFTVPLGELLRRNETRPEAEKVPESVIRRMYINTDIPRAGVDCDTFMLAGHQYFNDEIIDADITGFDTIIKFTEDKDILEEILLNFDSHDTPYHLESIDTHIDMTIENSNSFAMKLVALFHDLGKGMAKNGGTYYSHEKLGAVYLLNALYYSVEASRSVFELELPEVVFQHMNGNRGLSDKVVKRNNLSPQLVKVINMFSEIDGKSRVVESQQEV